MNLTKWQSSLSPLIAPLGHAYAGLMRLRAKAFKHGPVPSWYPNVPCISVGNISWGGTGKTPMVSWLLDWTQQTGRHPVVLTRGYHGQPPHLPFHVKTTSSPEQSGDEPLMLARAHGHAEVVVDPKRIRSGPWGEQKFSPDLFILDDGFQHLAVQRDVDIVLLAEQDLLEGWNRVIPAGSWREGEKALDRTDAFVVNITGSSLDQLFPAAVSRLKQCGRPIFFVQLVPVGLSRMQTNEKVAHLEEAPYFLFTGIANPDRVRATLTDLLGYPPADVRYFPDHHAFTADDKERIVQQALRAGASHIVCTPKDAIKISGWDYPNLFELRTRLSFVARANTSLWFPDWLAHRLGNV
ncbi:tetraacyldisaccharide 4'-kinase [Desulfoplanes sp.]